MSGHPYYYGNTYQSYDANQRDATEDVASNANQTNNYYGNTYQTSRSGYDTSSNQTMNQSSYSTYQQPQTQQTSNAAQQWYTANRDSSAQAAQALTAMQTNPSQVRINSPAVTPAYNAPVANSASYPSAVASSTQSQSHARVSSATNSAGYGVAAQQQQNQQMYANAQSYQSANTQMQARPRSVNSVRSQSAQVPSPVLTNATQAQTYTQAQPQQIPQTNTYQAVSNQQQNSRNKSTASRNQRAQQNLPSVSQITQTNLPATSSSYTYQANNSTASNSRQSDQTYAQSTTVDPTAVYDPWPEYQRKLDAAKATKAALDAEAARKKEAEDKRKAEEEAMKAAEAQRLEQERLAEEQRLREEEEAEAERQKAAQEAADGEEKKRKKKEAAARARERNKLKKQQANSMAAETSDVTPIPTPVPANSNDPEAALREMMAKIRALNEQNPDLVARIWEEERQTHVQATGTPTAPQAESTPVPAKSKSKKASAAATNTPVQGDSTATGSGKKSKKSQEKNAAKMSGSAQVDSTASNTAVPASSEKYPANIARTLSHQPPPSNQQNTRAPPAISTSTDAGMALSKPQIAKFAAVTVKILSARFDNTPQSLNPREIEGMLEDNPSYKDFCTRLETRGYKVDRRALAQALLPYMQSKNAGTSTVTATATPTPVPTTTASQKAAMSAAGVRSQSNQKTSDVAPPRWTPTNLPSSTTPVPPPIQHGLALLPSTSVYDAPSSYRSPYFLNPQSTGVAYSVPGQDGDDNGLGTAESSAPPPAVSQSTEVADPVSKKRTFSSLVDLTGVDSSDDDDDLPPAKRYQEDLLGPTAPTATMQVPPHLRPLVPPTFEFNARNTQYMPVNNYPRVPINNLGVPVPPTAPLRDDLKDVELSKPIERSKARRRNWYDVRTIARDVLLATGRHPELRPLNAHLDSVRANLRGKVYEHADLSTLRWDLIDPGEPIPLPELEDDKDSVAGDDADDESEQEPVPTVPRVAVRIAAGGPGDDGPGVAIPDLSVRPNKDLSMPRKRGRPPGSTKNRMSTGTQFTPVNPDKDGRRHTFGGNSVGAGPGRPRQAAPSQSSGTPGGGTGPGGGMNYVEYRAAMAARGVILPPTGRPQGWRPGIIVPPTGDIPMPPAQPRPSGAGPGRPPGTGPASRPARLPDAVYPKFKCQWDHCKAELHNLATLRKHVHKVHKQAGENGMFECKWSTCGKSSRVFDRKENKVIEISKRMQFEDDKSWGDHIEERHIQRVGWELGDGPAGGMSGTSDSEAYLSDSRGRQTTPRITVPDSMTPALSAGRSGPIPARIPKPATSTPVDKARQRMEDVARRRRIIGPGLDKGGATFANAAMKKGFVEEDFDEMIVGEEEDGDGEMVQDEIEDDNGDVEMGEDD